LSFLSLFMRQGPAAANARKGKGINGLRRFPEKCCERDPVRIQLPKTSVKSG